MRLGAAAAVLSSFALAFGAGGLVVGCGTDSGGTGPTPDAATQEGGGYDVNVPPEGGTPDVGADTAPDVTAEAAPPCSGVICNGVCMAASDCHACSGAHLLCAPKHTCVEACAGCADSNDAGLPIECFACDSNHANPIGTCQPSDNAKYCLSGSYLNVYSGGAAGYHCGCGDGGAADCPGNSQVCARTPGGTTFCVTCGEVYIYDLTDAGCKGGKSCNPEAAACE